MSLATYLSARAYKEDRAIRKALFRHRAIEDMPIFLVAWQDGSDPFSCSAMALGRSNATDEVEAEPLDLFVMSDSNDWGIESMEFFQIAKRFCAFFEDYLVTETIEYRDKILEVPVWLPQIIVPNRQTIGLLGMMGRRLSYAKHSDRTIEQTLRRFAWHMIWITRHADLPGQQLILPCTELLNLHYTTASSMLESNSLFALEAWIEPPARIGGFAASIEAERSSAGPALSPEVALSVSESLSAIRNARKENDKDAEDEALVDLRSKYRGITDPVHKLMLRIVRRELLCKEAAHLVRRVNRDRIRYALHRDQTEHALGNPRGIRTTENAREAAMRRDEIERSADLLRVEQLLDDPLLMLPYILSGEAIEGRVVRCRTEDTGRTKLTIEMEDLCVLPPGFKLWWTGIPHGYPWLIETIDDSAKTCRVTLAHPCLKKCSVPLPNKGQRIRFTPFYFDKHLNRSIALPPKAPWTHRPSLMSTV